VRDAVDRSVREGAISPAGKVILTSDNLLSTSSRFVRTTTDEVLAKYKAFGSGQAR